jgi:hypothetical protein
VLGLVAGAPGLLGGLHGLWPCRAGNHAVDQRSFGSPDGALRSVGEKGLGIARLSRAPRLIVSLMLGNFREPWYPKVTARGRAQAPFSGRTERTLGRAHSPGAPERIEPLPAHSAGRPGDRSGYRTLSARGFEPSSLLLLPLASYLLPKRTAQSDRTTTTRPPGRSSLLYCFPIFLLREANLIPRLSAARPNADENALSRRLPEGSRSALADLRRKRVKSPAHVHGARATRRDERWHRRSGPVT